MIDPATLDALRAFPDALDRHFRAIPAELAAWVPPDWRGIPSERFSAVEQVWHVHDIELEGYRLRFRRTLEEDVPLLADIDSEAITPGRRYASRDAGAALAAFARERALTVAQIERWDARVLARAAVFEGLGPVTLRGLVHLLCSHDQQHLAGLQWLRARMPAG